MLSKQGGSVTIVKGMGFFLSAWGARGLGFLDLKNLELN